MLPGGEHHRSPWGHTETGPRNRGLRDANVHFTDVGYSFGELLRVADLNISKVQARRARRKGPSLRRPKLTSAKPRFAGVKYKRAVFVPDKTGLSTISSAACAFTNMRRIKMEAIASRDRPITRGRVMELYLKVYRLIKQVSVVHSKAQMKTQRARIASVSLVHDSFTAATSTNT